MNKVRVIINTLFIISAIGCLLIWWIFKLRPSDLNIILVYIIAIFGVIKQLLDE